MKPIKTYVCLVDNYRRLSRKRNTAGRYLVGAKTEKEAKQLLQKAIGFGSVQVYYTAFPTDERSNGIDIPMRYKEIKRVCTGCEQNASGDYVRTTDYIDPKHACQRRK